MFIVVRKKHIVLFAIFSICIVVLGLVISTIVNLKTVNIRPEANYTVVIDAGHGGIDGGSVGKVTKVTESSLNLAFAKNLQQQLKEMNISSVLTREDENGLYDSSAKNLKRSDMKKRQDIITSFQPKIVVSLHMNSFPLTSSRGAQTFYKKGNEQGKILADNIQKQLSAMVENTGVSGKVGDYYIVNCTDIPSVLIECGFLSNPEEEFLLQDKNYQNKLCYKIMCGIISFLNN
ncbi:MAG: N-acetylmuramoyl-L-alanine amidase [Clostridia bacterium]|nr:N-acetylmuramoyl-L-alanine amidase [Clostridia bacterium]